MCVYYFQNLYFQSDSVCTKISFAFWKVCGWRLFQVDTFYIFHFLLISLFLIFVYLFTNFSLICEGIIIVIIWPDIWVNILWIRQNFHIFFLLSISFLLNIDCLAISCFTGLFYTFYATFNSIRLCFCDDAEHHRLLLVC